MATHCFICQKHADNGNNVSHAKNRTKRMRKPNLHTAHINIGGENKKIALCSSCRKTLRKVTLAPVAAV
ncbi:MAG TPA: 50S ribosomal protein L28 [Patescibacteria group bacterium]|nr:50S ribosomal protein L28 [Patescibacteria group bacterium]